MLIGGYSVRFPFTPYPSQLLMMDRLIRGLKQSEHALLESPTGTGKTLSLLCAALAWQEKEKAAALQRTKEAQASKRTKLEVELSEEDVVQAFPSLDRHRQQMQKEAEEEAKYPRIFFGSRTHSQIAQLRRELERTAYRPTISVLASRDHYCIHPRVSKSTHKSYECKRLNARQAQGCGCSYKKNKKALINDAALQPGGELEVWDIEDLVALGSDLKACPYFAARSIGKKADLVFCPYNHLIDPGVRGTYGIELEGNVVILDEAHNIEDACRNAASVEVSYTDIKDTAAVLASIIQGTKNEEALENHRLVYKLLHEWELWIAKTTPTLEQKAFETNVKVFSGRDKLALLNEMGLTADNYEAHHTAMESVLQYSAEAKEGQDKLNAKGTTVVQSLFKLWKFFFLHNGRFMDDYRLVLQQTSQRDKERQTSFWVQTLCVWCLNPAVAFTALADQARTVVLTSGTLAPIETLRTELGAAFPIHLEAKHVIDVEKQLWVGTIPRGRSNVAFNAVFKNADTFSFQDDIGEAIVDCCRVIPHGVLCFFPSYGLLERVVERWRATQLWDRLCSVKQVFIEPRQKGQGDFDTLIKRYYAVIKRGSGGPPSGPAPASNDAPPPMAHSLRGRRERAKSARNEEADDQATATNGALFLAVYRGKVSEGIDFSDDNARGVIAVGIPFPNLKDPQMKLKREYNEMHSRGRKATINGSRWYELQAWRAVNQAIGRCIRHRHDYGAIVFLEERMQRSESVAMLPRWVVQGMTHFDTLPDSLASLRDFFRSARDRPPPPPGAAATTPCKEEEHPISPSSSLTRSPSLSAPSWPRQRTPSPSPSPPPSGFSLKRTTSAPYFPSSSPSASQPPPRPSGQSSDYNAGDGHSPLSPIPLSPPLRRPLGHASSSPSLSTLSPSQPRGSPSLSSLSSPSQVRADSSSPSFSPTPLTSSPHSSQPASSTTSSSSSSSSSPVLCCNVCSSPLAYQQGAQEQTTKQYFCKLVSHSVRGTPHSQPWEVPLYRLGTADLIRENCRALTEDEVATLKPDMPATSSSSAATPGEQRSRPPAGGTGAAMKTIWATTDGLVYVPLFCCRCRPPRWVGVVVKAASGAGNREFLRQVWLASEAASPLSFLLD